MTTTGTTRSAPAHFSVLAAPGTVPAALRALGSAVDVRELLSPETGDVPDAPTVVLVTSAILTEGPEVLERLPDHAVLVAVDAEGREAADEVGRLFLSLDEVTGDEAVLRAI